MAGHSRKRGQREKPAPVASAPKPTPAPVASAAKPTPRPDHSAVIQARYENRNAAVRAALEPLAPGERPRAVTVGALLAAASGIGNLIAYLAGAKIAGKHPAASGIIGFTGLMLICAYGMWRVRYWAVLGFMGLLAIIATIFTLLLVEASNLLGFLVPPFIIAGAGYLFWKLVRSLSRIQMPQAPGR